MADDLKRKFDPARDFPQSPHEVILSRHHFYKHGGDANDCKNCDDARREWIREFYAQIQHDAKVAEPRLDEEKS